MSNYVNNCLIIWTQLSARVVKISATLKAVPDDPDNDMVVKCAMVGGATHIITGDKHLLGLAIYQGIEILKAADFIPLLSQS